MRLKCNSCSPPTICACSASPPPCWSVKSANAILLITKAMENQSGSPTCPHAGLPGLSQATLAHSTPISTESLNDLQLFGLQKCPSFTEVTENAMDTSNSALDLAGFQSLDRNTHLSASSSSGFPTNPLSTPFVPVNNKNIPRVAYSPDIISSIRHSEQFNQVSTISHPFTMLTMNYTG